MQKRLQRLFQRFYPQGDTDALFNVSLLLYFQIALAAFLLITLAVIALLTPAAKRAFYLIMAGSLLCLLVGAIHLNLTGHHKPSLYFTALLMFIGPWLSILYELTLNSNDIMPMVYIIIPIQITAMFIQVRAVFWLSLVQFLGLTALLVINRGQYAGNWPSLLCFVLVASMLGIIASYVVRKQYELVARSRNDLALSERKLRDISIRDPLTGLFNRRFMDEEFALLLDRPDQVFSLMMVDVDHFKGFNDHFGHSCGDEIIREVARILSSAIRKNDIACRYGGDEFLLFLVDCSLCCALAKAEAIKQQIESISWKPDAYSSMAGERQERLTASIGVAQCPTNGQDRNALLKAADDALYRAKQGGRNRIVSAEELYRATDRP